MKGNIERLHPDLHELLTALELYMGFELNITSGYRSPEHNRDPKVGGVENSEHTYEPCEGADVLCLQSITRYKMIAWLMKRGVTRIGIGRTFIHIGIAEDKPQYVLWHYYED